MASRLSQLIEKSQIATTPVATTIPTAGSRLNLIQKEEIIPEIPKAVQIFPSVMQILTELQIDPLSLKEKPEEAIGVAWKTLSETFSKSASELQDFFQIQTKEPVSKEVGEKFKEIAAGGHILFSPISALFEGANKIPVLGSVSRLLSLPFVAVGEGGTKIVRKIIKNIAEQIMPNETKENITEGLEEIFALGSQLVLGKITHITTKKTV